MNLQLRHALLGMAWSVLICSSLAAEDERWVALRQAVREANLTTVDKLLDSGVDVNHQDEAGWTVLHWWNFSFDFARKPFIGTLERLIARGVDVNLTDIHGRTALMLLLVPGDDQPQTSPLEAIKALVKAGSDLDKQDDQGQSALTLGRSSKFKDVRAYFRTLEKSRPNR